MGQISSYFNKQIIDGVGSESVDSKYEQTYSDTRQSYIASKFHFSHLEFDALKKVFMDIDLNKQGAITQEDLFFFLKEELISIISPYLLYLFQLIEKENDNRITFLELIPTMSGFCLYSQDQVLSFVFQMMDQDHDNYISKKDIMKFLVSERFNSKIFPFNYVKAVELMELERPDKITFDAFKKIEKEVPFICYPAFRLQQSLKKKFLGDKFWLGVGEKIANRENEENKLKQLDRIKEEVRKKQQIKIDQKIGKFVQITQDLIIPHYFIQKNRPRRTKDRSNSEYNISTLCQPPELLIDSVYQQLQKFEGAPKVARDAKKDSKDIQSLHWGSRSETYTKRSLKIISQRRKDGNNQQQSSLPMTNNVAKNSLSRKSIYKESTKNRDLNEVQDNSFLSSSSSKII